MTKLYELYVFINNLAELYVFVIKLTELNVFGNFISYLWMNPA